MGILIFNPAGLVIVALAFVIAFVIGKLAGHGCSVRFGS